MLITPRPGPLALLAAALLCAACTDAPSSQLQTITGQIDRESIGASVVGVRAVQGDAVVSTAAVEGDGRFVIDVPAGLGYRLEVVTPEGARGFVGRDGGAVQPSFDVCDPQDPYDVGEVIAGNGGGGCSDPPPPPDWCPPGVPPEECYGPCMGKADANGNCDPCLFFPELCEDPCIYDPSLCEDPCNTFPELCEDPCMLQPELCEDPCAYDPMNCDPCAADPELCEDPCILHPELCEDPCLMEPALCEDPCNTYPELCEDPCVEDPSLCDPCTYDASGMCEDPCLEDPSLCEDLCLLYPGLCEDADPCVWDPAACECPMEDPNCWPLPTDPPCDANGMCDPDASVTPEQPLPDFGCARSEPDNG